MSFLEQVIAPAAKGALTIGMPLSIGYLVYQMTPHFAALDDEQKVRYLLQREAVAMSIAASALSVVVTGGILLYLLRGSRR